MLPYHQVRSKALEEQYLSLHDDFSIQLSIEHVPALFETIDDLKAGKPNRAVGEDEIPREIYALAPLKFGQLLYPFAGKMCRPSAGACLLVSWHPA